MAHEEDYDDILAAKDKEIATYARALKIANESFDDLLKERDNLRKIAVKEHKEANELRMQVLKLERVVKAWADHKKEAKL